MDNARYKYKGKGNLMHFVVFALNGFLEEVTQIASEAYDFVKRKMYKDYLFECYMQKDSKVSKRAYQIALYLPENKPSIPKKIINNGGDPLFDSLLDKVSLTIKKDIERLTDEKLLKWENDELSVNIDIMNQFT